MEEPAESAAEEDTRSDERINSVLQTSSSQIKNPELLQQFNQSSSSNLDPSLDQHSHTPHTVAELNVSDNCSTPDKFLNLFGTEMVDIDRVSGVVEIGDEVTVTAVSSSPLTFHNFTDHSYFSSPRLATPPSSIRFSDCQDADSISISDPGLQLPLPEFHIHDLFDLGSEYQAFDNFLRYHDNNIDLQEQIIDSGQSTRDSESFQNQSQSHQSQFSWMFPCDIPGGDSYDCDNENENTNEENSDSSSEEEMIEDTDSEKNPAENLTKSYGNERKDHYSDEERKEKRTTTANASHHHTGPFPHTFISVPGDRRSRFCFGLQTIVTKIRALMSRTGATANFKAEFENHTFTLENVDKLVKLSNRSQSQKSAGRKSKKGTTGASKISDPPSPCGNSNQSEGAGAGADDDHRYAATILTQTESSSTVRDHQYNEVSTTNCEGDKRTSSCTEKTYIRTRYARERWLRKVATTIYSKMQRLINRTGAKMTLLIEYEGHLVTPKNYKELEHLLGTYRPALKKFNTKIVIQNHSQGHSQASSSSLCGMRENEFLARVNNVSEAEIVNVSSTHGKGASTSGKTGLGGEQDTLMKMRVSFPRSKKALNQSLQIEFLDTSSSSAPCVSAAPVLSNCFSGTGIRGSGSCVENSLRPTTTATIETEHDYDSQHGVDHSHNFHSDFFDESPVPTPSLSTSIHDVSSRSTRGYTNATSGTSGSSSFPIPYEAPARSSNIPNTNTMSCSSTFEPILEMSSTGPPPPAAVVTSTSVSTLFCDRNLGVSNNDDNALLNRLVEPSRVMKRSVDAYTITDPRCELCGGGSQTSLAGSGASLILPSSKSKFPLWIRCANPLCQYLVHPSCIGFFVINAQQLQLLPPFFCPGHRDNS